MFVKKITVIFILTIHTSSSKCALQSKDYDENQSNSDEYNLVYIKSTKPEFEYNHAAESVGKDSLAYAALQYAPLVLNSEEQSLYDKSKIDARLTIPEFKLNSSKMRKTNLEPRLEEYKKIQTHGLKNDAVIYGHNIQIPELKKEHSINDIGYKKDIELTTKENIKKVNYEYINIYPYHHKTEYQTEKITIKPSEVNINNKQFVKKPSRIGQVYNVISTNFNNENKKYKNERVLYEKETPLIQPQLLYARPYRLHLNVARAFNIVNTPNNKAKMINKIPSPSQTLIRMPESTHLLQISDTGSKLYPRHNKYEYVHYRS